MPREEALGLDTDNVMGELVLPTFCDPKFTVDGESTGMTPVPLTGTV
jgi:hypothetical protein